LARLLFAEIGQKPEEDLFLRVEYDGAIVTNSAGASSTRHGFAVLSATKQAAELMEAFLENQHAADADLERTIGIALDAWSIGHMAMGEDGVKELPESAVIARHWQEQFAERGVEAAILERAGKTAIRYRALSDQEVGSVIKR
jgi:hypothetical protein